ncbi:hypothetical protein [Allofranklinella schreckenbergeri]|uniref:hypothetical protein n=1 Tax=Allofranklinella schreckenbergeri TaxID=1076744 RepID=UPI0011C38AD3|nr:hypothetical protein [Allofranklinella schreckenbergeri]
MQQYLAKVHTSHGMSFGFSKVISYDTGAGFRSTINGKSNSHGCWYLIPKRPESIARDDNRLTVALDICFTNGYLGKHHFAMGLRHLDSDYKKAGDNRCGAAILGAWKLNASENYTHAIGIEEIEIDNSFKNVHPVSQSNVVQHDKRYRLILDSVVRFNRFSDSIEVINEIRLKDYAAGKVVFSSSRASDFSGNYIVDARGIILASLSDESVPGGSYSNLISYWSPANVRIPEP